MVHPNQQPDPRRTSAGYSEADLAQQERNRQAEKVRKDAARYFADSGTVLSLTDAQFFHIPGTDERLPAEEAREISLHSRSS